MKYMFSLLSLIACLNNCMSELTQNTELIPEEIVQMYKTMLWQDLGELADKTTLVLDQTASGRAKLKRMPVLETALGALYWRIAVNGINETLTQDPEVNERAHAYVAAAHAHPEMQRCLMLAELSPKEAAHYWHRYHGYVNRHITKTICFHIALLNSLPSIKGTIIANAGFHTKMPPQHIFEYKAHLLARLLSLTYQLKQNPEIFRKRFAHTSTVDTATA